MEGDHLPPPQGERVCVFLSWRTIGSQTRDVGSPGLFACVHVCVCVCVCALYVCEKGVELSDLRYAHNICVTV